MDCLGPLQLVIHVGHNRHAVGTRWDKTNKMFTSLNMLISFVFLVPLLSAMTVLYDVNA